MEGILVLFFIVFIVLIIAGITGPKEEGTLEERKKDPKLNTNNISIHTERLGKLRKSKFKGVMYYQGPKGGRYYYSPKNGNKVYV